MNKSHYFLFIFISLSANIVPMDVSAYMRQQRNFLCRICGSTLSSKGGLQAHQKIHSDQKPYECTICDKAFKVKKYLDQHLAKHKPEKDLACDACDNKFLRTNDLKWHKKLSCKKTKIQALDITNPTNQELSQHIGNDTFILELLNFFDTTNQPNS